MPSLLIVMFALQLAIYIINSVGAQTVSELAWTLYNKLPTPTSGAVAKAMKQRKELHKLKKELGSVSPQDDFARWAKLDRQHNKLEADLQQTTASLSSAKTQFTTIVGGMRFVGTTGARFVLQFWFTKQAMFWIPAGWLPYYVEWIVSFPRAPLGSISIQVWGMACGAVIALAADAIGAIIALASGQTTGQKAQSEKPNAKGQPMGMAAQGSKDIKKEL